MQLTRHGVLLRAESHGKDLYGAIDDVHDELFREISSQKEKATDSMDLKSACGKRNDKRTCPWKNSLYKHSTRVFCIVIAFYLLVFKVILVRHFFPSGITVSITNCSPSWWAVFYFIRICVPPVCSLKKYNPGHGVYARTLPTVPPGSFLVSTRPCSFVIFW